MDYKKHWILFKYTIILGFVTFMLFLVSFFSDYGIVGVVTLIRTYFMYRSEKKEYDKYNVYEDDEKYIIHRGEEYFVLDKNNIRTKSFKDSRFTKELTLRIVYSLSGNNENNENNERLEFVFTGLKRKVKT